MTKSSSTPGRRPGKARGRSSKGNRRVAARKQSPEPNKGLPWRGALSVFLTVVALGGVGIGVTFGWEALRHSPWLRVQSIEVVGNQRVSAREIQTYAGLRVGDPILDLNLDATGFRLRKHPWLNNVSVRRSLPNKVSIRVEECEPRVLVSLGEIYIANALGHPFKRLGAVDQVVLPVVTGITREQASRDPEAMSARVRKAIDLMDALEDKGRPLGTLDEVHWDQALGFDVITRGGIGHGPVRIRLGKDPIRRIGVAARALQELRQLGRTPAVVWADVDDKARRVQLRLSQKKTTQESQTLIARAR